MRGEGLRVILSRRSAVLRQPQPIGRQVGTCKGNQDLGTLCLQGRRFPPRIEDPLPPERVKTCANALQIIQANQQLCHFIQTFIHPSCAQIKQ